MYRIANLLWSRASLAGRRARVLPQPAVLALALALAALPGAVPAHAHAHRTALTGTDQRFFGPPARVFVDDGLTQVRGIPQTGTFAFSGPGVTLAGAENDVANGSIDATGSGHVWATVHYTDTASGVTCSGTAQGELTNGLAINNVVARCSNGARLKGTLRDTETFPAGQVPPIWVKSDFTGVLISPGEGED